MYAILNPDGTFRELREGQLKEGDNVANKGKPYAVLVTDTRPVRVEGQRWVNERKMVSPTLVTLTADGVETIPVPTDAEIAEAHMMQDAFARGLIRILANRFGITPIQVIEAIKIQAEI